MFFAVALGRMQIDLQLHYATLVGIPVHLPTWVYAVRF